MRRRLLPVGPVVLVLVLGAVAGCGGGGSVTTLTLDGPGAGVTPPSPKAFGLPAGVPTRSDGGAADPVSRRVIRKWLGALSGGQIRRAARFFAVPAKVQNGTRVLTLRSPAARIVFNDAFPCGARATRLKHARGGFTIVDFVLTERVGGDCGGGAGGRARSAIRVLSGHIVEWYRLDSLPTGHPAPSAPAPLPEPGPGTQIA